MLFDMNDIDFIQVDYLLGLWGIRRKCYVPA